MTQYAYVSMTGIIATAAINMDKDKEQIEKSGRTIGAISITTFNHQKDVFSLGNKEKREATAQ